MSNKTATSEVTWALLTEGVASSRIELHRLKHLLNRALSLVEQSDAKEHLYEVAGDIIQGVPAKLDAVGRGLDRTSYALSKIGVDHLRSRLPIDDRNKVEEGVVQPKPRSVSAARVALRWREKQGDLNPQLGWPGGPCHVMDRIWKEVQSPRLRDELIEDVEMGLKLDNSQANKIYDLEAERGAGLFKKVLLTPHAQYRMDQRNVTVNDIRFGLKEFSDRYLHGKQFLKQQVRKRKLVELQNFARSVQIDMARREPIQHTDEHKLVLVFVADRDVARVITTYWQGVPDPRPKQVEQCPVTFE